MLIFYSFKRGLSVIVEHLRYRSEEGDERLSAVYISIKYFWGFLTRIRKLHPNTLHLAVLNVVFHLDSALKMSGMVKDVCGKANLARLSFSSKICSSD